MMQAQTQVAWRDVAGADCISSEDESWLNHSGFHLSDSEEDELQSVGVQYVHAVNAIKRAGLQASSQELYGQLQPLLLEAPAREGPSEGDNNESHTGVPSATVQADQKQHTMHALETLLPHEQATHLGTQATSTGPANHISSQPKQLSSPASKVATKPFPSAPPAALAQQQAQQRPMPHQSQNPVAAPAVAAAAAAVPLLELSLSSHQIALLQAAADNAQRYMDRDVANAGEDAKQLLDAMSDPTADGAAPQHGTDWDMQSAIMAAFDTLLPADADAAAEATAPSAAHSAAHSAAPSASADGQAPLADQTLTSAAPVIPSQPLPGQTEMSPAVATIAGATKTGTTATETTAQGATKTTANANRLNAALAVTSTAAAPSSAAAEPVAVSSQTPSGTPTSKQILTACTNTPAPSDKFTPQSASLGGTPTAAAAAAQPVLGSLHQALPISGSTEPPLAVVPASATAMAPMAVHPHPLGPTQAVHSSGDRGQAASKLASKGVSAPPRGAGRSLVASAGTASDTASVTVSGSAAGTSPQLNGSSTLSTVGATAVTQPAKAAALPASAATTPVIAATTPAKAAIPPAIAATLPATAAATPSATALTASAPLASQVATDKLSAGLGTAAQGSAAVPLGAAKAKGPSHSTAPVAIMVTHGLAALTPRPSVPPSRGQAPGLPANLTAAPQTSTAAALLPPDLSLAALSAGTPAFSWAPREPFDVPQLQVFVDPTPSATPHATPGTAASFGGFSHPGFPQTQLVAPPSMPFGASAERPFQFPANLAPTPAPASITPSASQGFARFPASPSLFSPAPAAAPTKKKPTKASKKRKAGQQATPSPAPPATGANLLPVSDKKRKAERQAVPSPLPPQSGTKSSPAATASAAARAPPDAPVPSSNPKQNQPDPNRGPLESFDLVSPQLTAMRNAHGGCYIPMVGSHAVEPHLEDVMSLVTDSKYKYKLTDVISAIGDFAVGRKQQQDIFLGDLHSSRSHSQLVPSVAKLFGVKASKSLNAASFHEKFRLTELVKLPQAGILTRHGDMLMYYILELAELSKLNEKQGGHTYKKEYSATLGLARAVGRKLKGAEGDTNALDSGCQVRLQQLADKGYLAVKRRKSELRRIRPARYPGWEGRPRYGPAICFPPLPPPPAAAKATAAAHRPKPAKATPPAELKHKATPPAAKATAVPTAPPSHQIPPGLQSTPSSAAAMQPAAAGPLPPPSQTPNPTPQTGPPSSATVASVLALSPPSSVQQATATATTQLPEPNTGGFQQQQQQQPPISGTTAALVAAVGPLFESFVAQAAAVATNPDMSLQTLQGSITQELAAAIASAAMQVIEQRREQLNPIADSSPANIDTPLIKAAASVPKPNAPVLAERSEPAVVGSIPLDQLSGSSLQKDSRDACNNARSVVVNDSQKVDDGVCGTGKAATTESDGLSKGSDSGRRKRLAASSDVAVTSEIEQNRKRASSNAKDQQSDAKRQKTDGPPPKGGTKSEGHISVSSKHATRSDTSSSDRAQRGSGGKQAKGQKGSGRGSPVSRGSRGSGKSSPNGPFGAGPQSHTLQPTSPQPMGRNNMGLPNGPGAAMLPSRLSSHYATGSPMLTVPLPFVPNAPVNLDFQPSIAYSDMMLSPQAAMANGFMPLMPSCPGDWHMQQPALNNFPMAAHFLPGVSEAPDFSPLN